MNQYQFSDMRLGLNAKFDVQLTLEMLDGFMSLSGDSNPLHQNDAYALEKGFPGRVAFGMLTSALYSRLVGVHLPGKHCLLQGIEVAFQKPAFVGDVLTVDGAVSYINESYQVIELKAEIRNQLGHRISKAKIKVGFI